MTFWKKVEDNAQQRTSKWYGKGDESSDRVLSRDGSPREAEIVLNESQGNRGVTFFLKPNISLSG